MLRQHVLTACLKNFLIWTPVITSADKHVLTLAMKLDFPFFSFSATRLRYVPYFEHTQMYSTRLPQQFRYGILELALLPLQVWVPIYCIVPCSFKKSEHKDI